MTRLVLRRWAEKGGVFYLEDDWKHLKAIEAAIRASTPVSASAAP